MNKFKFYFILMISAFALFSCSKKDDETEIAPPRDFAEQNTADSAIIEKYLQDYYIDVTDPNFADQDVKIEKITNAVTQPSIWSYKNNAVQGGTTFPQLWSRDVKLHDITYKVYYLVLREGVGQSPSNVDGVLAAYRGDYLTSKTEASVTTITPTFFEQTKFPQQMYDLSNVIKGWSEIFPKFKTGNYSEHLVNGVPDGTVDYSDFGAGVMFVPSGLAYYNLGKGDIPAYAPLVFSFKLHAIQRQDHDGDGIPSYLEDLDGDGYMRVLAKGVVNPDDTDGDEIPNFLDIDDDGDNYTTKFEIKNPLTELAYPFAEIPSCNGNTTDPARIKKHLDKSCH